MQGVVDNRLGYLLWELNRMHLYGKNMKNTFLQSFDNDLNLHCIADWIRTINIINLLRL